MKKLPVSRIHELYAAISASKALYLPLEKAGQVNYGLWSESETVRLDELNTVRSAKDLFFPQTENMMGFKMQGKTIEIVAPVPEDTDFVLMGVRACDARSFDVLDRVFLSEPVDTYYANRRAHGTVVTMACHEPEETCFCTVFGVDPTNAGGDVTCWIANDTLYWNANTEKGEALTAALSDVLADADAADEKAVEDEKAAVAKILERLPLADLNLEGFNGDALTEKFNSPKWAELSRSCLACGTCTFVCPTCQCYDIRDYDTGHGIQRYRCWDSCMYSDFTMMAHGNNRNSQLERFRQRFMHKLIYFPANNDGMYSCVGCGRCLAKCPISMNIAKVIKALGVND
ncbi:MAG: 4Fe-4S dicluster domain-containing protein [Clostridia bacterium]|nr:4Fe-4S dicluster domain-containing protein [Clostridia bacterium]